MRAIKCVQFSQYFNTWRAWIKSFQARHVYQWKKRSLHRCSFSTECYVSMLVPLLIAARCFTSCGHIPAGYILWQVQYLKVQCTFRGMPNIFWNLERSFPATSKVSSYWILTKLEKRPDAAWLLVLRDSKNMVTFFGKLSCYSRREVCFASWICLKFLLSASRWLHWLLGNSGWYVLHWWCHVVSLRFVGWPVGMVWLALGLGTWCEMNGLRLHLFVDMNGFPLHSMLFASVWMPLPWVAVSQFVRLVLFFWNYWVVMR